MNGRGGVVVRGGKKGVVEGGCREMRVMRRVLGRRSREAVLMSSLRRAAGPAGRGGGGGSGGRGGRGERGDRGGK